MNGFHELRLRTGLSVRELADVFEISDQLVLAYEQGAHQPPPRIIQCMKGLALPIQVSAGRSGRNYSSQNLFDLVGGLPRQSKGNGKQTSQLLPLFSGVRAIECDAFPFEALSDIAEAESWRKEINRPLSHIHKWWAQRLGTVFRAIALGALAPMNADVFNLFYSRVRIPDAVIFDPFMGSGTTISEAVKLGARAIGRDINPVSYFLVRNALAMHDRAAVIDTFKAIERDVADVLLRLYEAELPDGRRVPVLYYFWVKAVPCPACGVTVDLFSSYIFAQHAYRKRFPEAQAVCPHCGGVNTVRFDATAATCCSCRKDFDPSTGPAHGKHARCPSCIHTFNIAKTVRESGAPPDHRMYAKLVLMPDGSKAYLPVNDFDRSLFAKAQAELEQRSDAFPIVPIEPGSNTNQALGYNYRHWHEFFNARQLLGLSILGKRIQGITDEALRDLFVCLFSGALEFNNMFASYKGEGTGAVRHMFYHHILKPERVPLEANLWGTPKSSGSFSTMFESRILRALDYADNPFELRISASGRKNEKVHGISEPIGFVCGDSFADFERGRRVYLACGDSGRTDIASRSIDLILTDPPFFDNVHYSELADFFYVWQRHLLGAAGTFAAASTRSLEEVQNSNATAFTDRLGAIFAECHRTLKDDGLLVFTYHHSRGEGWRSILKALMDASFRIVAAHPIKAEMSVAAPKHQAKEPIDLDIVVVCRKRGTLVGSKCDGDPLVAANQVAIKQVSRFKAARRKLSRNDVRVIVMGQLLRELSAAATIHDALRVLDSSASKIEHVIATLSRDSFIRDEDRTTAFM